MRFPRLQQVGIYLEQRALVNFPAPYFSKKNFLSFIGRLDHRPKNAEELIPEKDGDGETTVKSIRGKPATHAPIDLAALSKCISASHICHVSH